MDWIQQQINDIEYWLHINEKQAILPTMEIEDELRKQEIKHKKDTLALLIKFKHHPNAKLHYEDVCSTPKTNYPQGL